MWGPEEFNKKSLEFLYLQLCYSSSYFISKSVINWKFPPSRFLFRPLCWRQLTESFRFIIVDISIFNQFWYSIDEFSTRILCVYLLKELYLKSYNSKTHYHVSLAINSTRRALLVNLSHAIDYTQCARACLPNNNIHSSVLQVPHIMRIQFYTT